MLTISDPFCFVVAVAAVDLPDVVASALMSCTKSEQFGKQLQYDNSHTDLSTKKVRTLCS